MLYAEDVNYWKTGTASPDIWIDRAKREIGAAGGRVYSEAFGRDIDAGAALIANLPALLDEALPEERRAIVRQLVSQVYCYRYEVYALRPTRNAELFFQSADPERWLTLVRIEARSAPNEQITERLRNPPIILAAA